MSRIVEIGKTELAALRRKAQAHDDYLAAIRTIEIKYARLYVTQPSPSREFAFARGYAAAINDLAQAVADEVGFRFTEAAMVSSAEPPLVFD